MAREILERLWRDNDADASRQDSKDPHAAGYRDGLDAANARIRAAMAGIPRDASTLRGQGEAFYPWDRNPGHTERGLAGTETGTVIRHDPHPIDYARGKLPTPRDE